MLGIRKRRLESEPTLLLIHRLWRGLAFHKIFDSWYTKQWHCPWKRLSEAPPGPGVPVGIIAGTGVSVRSAVLKKKKTFSPYLPIFLSLGVSLWFFPIIFSSTIKKWQNRCQSYSLCKSTEQPCRVVKGSSQLADNGKFCTSVPHSPLQDTVTQFWGFRRWQQGHQWPQCERLMCWPH